MSLLYLPERVLGKVIFAALTCHFFAFQYAVTKGSVGHVMNVNGHPFKPTTSKSRLQTAVLDLVAIAVTSQKNALVENLYIHLNVNCISVISLVNHMIS